MERDRESGIKSRATIVEHKLLQQQGLSVREGGFFVAAGLHSKKATDEGG